MRELLESSVRQRRLLVPGKPNLQPLGQGSMVEVRLAMWRDGIVTVIIARAVVSTLAVTISRFQW